MFSEATCLAGLASYLSANGDHPSIHPLAKPKSSRVVSFFFFTSSTKVAFNIELLGGHFHPQNNGKLEEMFLFKFF